MVSTETDFELPAPAAGPDVWYAADYESDTSWLHQFTDADIAEIEAAMAHAMGTGKPVIDLTRADFPLPTVAAKIDAAVRGGGGRARFRPAARHPPARLFA